MNIKLLFKLQFCTAGNMNRNTVFLLCSPDRFKFMCAVSDAVKGIRQLILCINRNSPVFCPKRMIIYADCCGKIFTSCQRCRSPAFGIFKDFFCPAADYRFSVFYYDQFLTDSVDFISVMLDHDNGAGIPVQKLHQFLLHLILQIDVQC